MHTFREAFDFVRSTVTLKSSSEIPPDYETKRVIFFQRKSGSSSSINSQAPIQTATCSSTAKKICLTSRWFAEKFRTQDFDMKPTLAILSLVALYCSVQGASLGNVDELKPLVTTVTSKISDLLKKVESEKEVTNIIEDSEAIRNAAEVVMEKTFEMTEDDNVENIVNDKDDEKKVDIMRFIAENAISNDDIVKILFADDQLEEDNLRTIMLMRSLSISGEGLQFDFTGFTSASSEPDKRKKLNNVKVWCQAIVKICGALVSAADDAEMTLRTQMGVFDDGQHAPSDGEETPELPPAGEKTPELPPTGKNKPNSDKHQRQRRAWFRRGNWGIDGRGGYWNSGRHTVWGRPTFNGLRPTGAQFGYTFSF